MKRVLGCIRKAVEEFNLIKDGDRVAVGVSGGKDSMILLHALNLFQYFSPVKYELEAITISLGFDDFDISSIREYCKSNNIKYTVKETNISKIVFDVRNEKNPCSLCANMRRGALHNVMKERNLNVLALGHHCDDAIETLFMNMFYTGRISTFSPKTFLDRKQIHVIRPMIYLSEAQIIGAHNRHELPLVQSPCPVDKKTTREEIKSLMNHIYKDIPKARQKLITAFKNEEQLNLWF
ncbi:MAG: tRNA 2-thiocytidine(32) synthetase TtcA [Firmicutes bacterium]|nr:tRNA 2-thiocytidine(32) synthetase TtcA [Bacillota bacterium]